VDTEQVTLELAPWALVVVGLAGLVKMVQTIVLTHLQVAVAA
jgi:hypothetical protein